MSAAGSSLRDARALFELYQEVEDQLNSVERKAGEVTPVLKDMSIILLQLTALTTRLGLGEDAREWIRTLYQIYRIIMLTNTALRTMTLALAGGVSPVIAVGGAIVSIVGEMATSASIEANRRL